MTISIDPTNCPAYALGMGTRLSRDEAIEIVRRVRCCDYDTEAAMDADLEHLVDGLGSAVLDHLKAAKADTADSEIVDAVMARKPILL